MHSIVRLTLITLALGLSACTVQQPYEQPSPPAETVTVMTEPLMACWPSAPTEPEPPLFHTWSRAGRWRSGPR